MTVKRIVANVAHPRPEEAKAFYGDILGITVSPTPCYSAA